MQPVAWYVRRLRAMSPAEVAWRVRSEVRDRCDALRLPLGLYPRAGAPAAGAFGTAPRWSAVPLGAWTGPNAGPPVDGWRDRLRSRADRIAAHRLSFFDLEDVHAGDPIDWNRELASGRSTPLAVASSIDYRDYSVTGDAKVAWEPNRHHHLLVLARAYRATGDRRYAAAVVEQLDSWIDQCPFGRGMHWRSPLELAVRLVNWIWTIDLIAGAPAMTAAFEARLLASIRLHVWEIARKYSQGSSANNHRIGEAAGVFTATSYFPQLPGAERLRAESARMLAEELVAQTTSEGATREQALGYQLFVMQLFAYAGLADRRSHAVLPEVFWERLALMYDFVAALGAGGPLPMYGDADDGYVLDFGDRAADAAMVLDVGARLFDRPSLRSGARQTSETAWWLFGADDGVRAAGPPAPQPLASRAFEEAGIYLLQWGDAGASDRVSVLFDCGPLGFGALAAHGHADALAVTARAFGVDVLVDPGTYDYFSVPEWRRYFRSTRAHNTVVIDGEDQSAQAGPFLWGRRAEARRLEWAPRDGGGRATGTHDGYARGADPVTCRRTVELDRASRTLVMTDGIEAAGAHDVTVVFHLGEECSAEQSDGAIQIDCGGAGRVSLAVDERLDVRMVKGGTADEGGWVSRGYHRRTPSWTIAGRLRIEGSVTLKTVLTFATV